MVRLHQGSEPIKPTRRSRLPRPANVRPPLLRRDAQLSIETYALPLNHTNTDLDPGEEREVNRSQEKLKSQQTGEEEEACQRGFNLQNYMTPSEIRSQAAIEYNSQDSASDVSERLSFSIGGPASKRTFSSYGSAMQTQPQDDSQDHASSDANDDDTRTEYSVTTNTEDGDYISELATNLLAETLELARATQIPVDAEEEERIWDRVFASLPILLQEFSLSVGHQASNQIQRDIMVFVHRHRRRIAEAFQAAYSSESRSFLRWTDTEQDKASFVSNWLETSDGVIQLEPPAELSSDGKDGKWPQHSLINQTFISDVLEQNVNLTSSPHGHSEVVRDAEEDGASEDDKAEARERIRMYGRFIYNLEAYQWLRTRLCRVFLTTPAEPDLMTEISQKVTNQLRRPHRISRRDSSKTYEATFQVEWNPQSFLFQQGYQEEPGDAFANALTLTGSAQAAQAAPCAQYLCEMWPLTGMVVCELMKHVVRGGRDAEHFAEFYDHTKLSACTKASQLVVKASGTKCSLAELAQQLAWLGSALPIRQGQVAPWTSASCRPLLVRLEENYNAGGNPVSNVIWDIQFEMKGEDAQNGISDGHCWTSLIRNRTLAQGFPVRRRPRRGIGLEITLDGISWLIKAPHATVFDGNLFIKGPRAMLLLAGQEGNALVWHLLESLDGSKISYADPSIPTISPEGISSSKLHDLESSRHFVGWCSKAFSLVGTPQANYDIGISDLEPSPVCPFKSMNISPGIRISGGKGFPVAYNSNAANSPSKPGRGYLQRLYDLAKESVALFDSEDKRSWLVDGVSVLLHLTRASLKREEEDPITHSWYQFKMKEYGQGSRISQNAAFSILMNPSNLEAPLHETPDSETFKQRVEDIWSFLEMVMDDEKRANEKQHACSFLEGFEFRHIATVTGPVSRRAIQLPPEGIASISLCREINAVALVGRGFGELIQSISPEGLCTSWQGVPRDRGYICVQTSHLRHVIESRTDKQYSIWGHIGNLYWRKSDMRFDERCCCREGNICDYARTLLTADQFNEPQGGPAGKTSDNLPPRGALIFGSSSRSSVILEPGLSHKEDSFGSNRGSTTTCDNSSATTFTHHQHFEISSPSDLSKRGKLFETDGSDVRQITSTQEAAYHEGNEEAGWRGTYDGKQKLAFKSLVHRPMGSDPNGGAGRPRMNSNPRRPQSRAEYNVVAICALKLEAEAFGTFFDLRWDMVGRAPGDPNAYSAGAIGPHNVVLAHMSGMGKSNAASVAAYVKTSFPNIKLALVVGICGAVPLPPGRDVIVLGDVIISDSIFQHDLGRRHAKDSFVPKKELRESLRYHTCQKLLNLMARLDTGYERKRLERTMTRYKTEAPCGPVHSADDRAGLDVGRFHTAYNHINSTQTCDECGCDGTPPQRHRLSQGNPEPAVHIGRLASGDSVFKSAEAARPRSGSRMRPPRRQRVRKLSCCITGSHDLGQSQYDDSSPGGLT